MSATRNVANPSAADGTTSGARPRLHWRRALLATTPALSLGSQNAYAICSDGSTLPPDGFVVGRDAQVKIAANCRPTSSPRPPARSLSSTND
jgi:hypothetical protein